MKPIEENKFKRRSLNGLEQLFASFHRATGDLVVVCSARVEALFHQSESERRLQNAIEIFYSQNPLLQTRIEKTSVQEADYLSLGACCPLLITQEKSWVQCLSEEINSPFPDTGPLWRFTVCHEQNASYFLIAAHHTICDGFTIVTVLRELLQLAATKAQESCFKNSFPHDPLQLLEEILVQKLPSITSLSPLDYPLETPRIDNPTVALSSRKAALLFHRFPTEEVEMMLRVCRQAQISLQPLLMTAYSRALFLSDLISTPQYRLNQMLPINLRRYLKGEKSQALGNIFACPSLITRGNQSWSITDWWREMQRINQELKLLLQYPNFLGMLETEATEMKSSVENLYQKCQLDQYHGRDYPSGVSNLGKMILTTDSALWDARNVYFSSGHGKMGTYLFISVLTTFEGMGICLDYPTPICCAQTAQSFLSNFCDGVRQLISSN